MYDCTGYNDRPIVRGEESAGVLNYKKKYGYKAACMGSTAITGPDSNLQLNYDFAEIDVASSTHRAKHPPVIKDFLRKTLRLYE